MLDFVPSLSGQQQRVQENVGSGHYRLQSKASFLERLSGFFDEERALFKLHIQFGLGSHLAPAVRACEKRWGCHSTR
jgi:hypothetical protein